MSMRVLSGTKPTGDMLHLGNYFGALKQFVLLQDDYEDALYFIADYHSMTTVRDGDLRRRYSENVALDYLAAGLDPDRAILFRQSDIPEVCELTWMLTTVTPMGMLERAHAYKAAKDQARNVDHGLFTYPVLMAADILAYDADVVPVGEDQVQHIEVCRDIAGSFNHKFGDTFMLPNAKVLDSSKKVPGTNGDKMSKSYNNTIEIFEPLKPQRKKLMRIETDSRPMEDPKEPDDDHLFQLYSLFADDAQRAELAATYRRGGVGYGDVKKQLADVSEQYFAEARSRHAEFSSSPDRVQEILADGARKARQKAGEVLRRAQGACGVKGPTA